MFRETLENVRTKKPLVHNITNYVTVNDCANALIACGGAPIMSDDLEEVEEITTICGGLCINIGTLNKNTIPAMFLAGKASKRLSHPVLLDPVGAGASKLRTETALKLINEVKPTIIRGNISEIKALAHGEGTTKGVDADISDAIDDSNIDSAVAFAKDFSAKTGAFIAITGKIDIVAGSERAYVIKNGNSMMSDISGTGCVLSSIVTAYAVANSGSILEATASAVCGFGLCGELAYERIKTNYGNMTYKNLLFDELYNLDGEKLEKGAKYEIF